MSRAAGPPPESAEHFAPAAAFAADYARLKAMAHRELTRVAPATVNTTELVHELFLRLGAVVSGRS